MTPYIPSPGQFDYLDDAHPEAARYARMCIEAAVQFGIGSPEHEKAKRKLARVAKQITQEG